MNNNGYPVTDYFVTIYPIGYVSQSQGPLRIGETANFICIKSAENEISGTIKDSSGNSPTDDITIIVKAYKTGISGGYVTKTLANTDGTFKLEGLNSELSYLLKFIAIQNNVIISSQWSGENEIGVNDRINAKKYKTIQTDEVNFRFSK